MDMPNYAVSIAQAINNLGFALLEAQDEIPAEIKTAHWVAMKHGPNAWQDVYYRCLADPNLDKRTIATLFALTKMISASEMLKGVINEIENLGEQPPPNLTLSKFRREGWAK